MPIVDLRLQNFRCFRDTRELALRPLTVIFGKNNAGKSSILHSLFLLRQTLDRPDDQRLNLRGPLYEAGSYADLVHQHRASTNVKMEFSVLVPPSRLGRYYVYGPRLHRKPSERPPLSGTVSMEFTSDEPEPPRLTRFQCDVGSNVVVISRGRGRGGPYELRLNGKAHADARVSMVLQGTSILPDFGRAFTRVPKELQLLQQAASIVDELRFMLGRMRAVGAFRAAPDRRYDYAGRPTEVIDLVGAAAVPALIDDSLRRGKNRGALLSGLNRWLAKVGRVKVMPLRRISRAARLYEVRIRDMESSRWANFADVGFGIGQALPVLVEGIRTPAPGMFVVQEPEIHLHPDAQLAMADYLMSLASDGRTVVVETHSEAMLLRIRTAIAQGPTKARPLQADDVSVLHVASERDGVSRIQQLPLNELGELKDWPSGFMDEVSEERLRLLSAVTAASERRQ